MRTFLIGTAAALALAMGGAAAADPGTPGATNWDGRGTAPGAGSTQTYTYGSGGTTTTTTTTTTLYPPSVPLTGYTPYGPSDHSLPDQGTSGSSPHASQIPTGTHCPPGTPDCGGAYR
ncbi:hypothetical protein [Azospirillum sp.]|uniref:hypothetical protein n=1 Tax=Azospirillum sp. TaxID=34012 RepID=UPI003D73E12B